MVKKQQTEEIDDFIRALREQALEKHRRVSLAPVDMEAARRRLLDRQHRLSEGAPAMAVSFPPVRLPAGYFVRPDKPASSEIAPSHPVITDEVAAVAPERSILPDLSAFGVRWKPSGGAPTASALPEPMEPRPQAPLVAEVCDLNAKTCEPNTDRETPSRRNASKPESGMAPVPTKSGPTTQECTANVDKAKQPRKPKSASIAPSVAPEPTAFELAAFEPAVVETFAPEAAPVAPCAIAPVPAPAVSNTGHGALPLKKSAPVQQAKPKVVKLPEFGNGSDTQIQMVATAVQAAAAQHQSRAVGRPMPTFSTMSAYDQAAGEVRSEAELPTPRFKVTMTRQSKKKSMWPFGTQKAA